MHAPVNDPKVTSSFGMRNLNGKPQHHNGIDFVSRSGDTRVFAIAPGKVVRDFDGYDHARRFLDRKHYGGNWCAVESVIEGQTFVVIYYHLKKNTVKLGQSVSAGDVLGDYSDYGYSFGAHLHLGFLQNGSPRDPTPYLERAGIPARRKP